MAAMSQISKKWRVNKNLCLRECSKDKKNQKGMENVLLSGVQVKHNERCGLKYSNAEIMES